SEQEIDPDELEEVLASATEITDPTEVDFLLRNLRRNLDDAWESRDEVTSDLEYRLSVTQDGSIIAFEPSAGTPEEATQKTPLPELTYTPTEDTIANSEEIALFRVVFTDNGVLQISPWSGLNGEPDFGPEITDKSKLRELNFELREKIIEQLPKEVSFPRDLEYRVGITEDLEIADYEAQNQGAIDFVAQTPIPEMFKPEAAGIGEEGENLIPKEPLGQFKVVFRANGVVEVSALRGVR
ncbi:MAG: DUF4335 domain-containing protein, partial [Okeania sp. SIO2D1]|nr:DUF4335 domain-containing protein [Okeania sp. SIO2D1]